MQEQEQRKKIAQWVRENRAKVLTRKRRTQALIHLGLAAIKAIQAGDLKSASLAPHIVENKIPLVNQLLRDENASEATTEPPSPPPEKDQKFIAKVKALLEEQGFNPDCLTDEQYREAMRQGEEDFRQQQ